MHKTFRTITFALAFCAASLSFSSCSNEATEGDHDEHTSPINDSGTNPNGSDTAIMNHDMDSGSNGGMHNMDPEGTNNGMDKREDGMNSGNTSGSSNAGSSSTTGTDTKNNGTREPNEYKSGRTGGQYSNPDATTTKSGTNTNVNPGTGNSGGTGKTSGSGK